jgi:flagellar P-ring protein precursor FlgI
LIVDDTRQRTDNLSVVTVTADLPVFAREGSKIDVTIAAFDDAESLLGGTLITSPLMGVDGRVYAVASGPVSVGGFSFGGAAASVQKNHPTSGRITNGATVELEVPTDYLNAGTFRLLLRHPNFQTAERISEAINQRFPGVAIAEDAAAISVIVPIEYNVNPVKFVSSVRSIMVAPDMAARVVINERTGTVVIGQHVRISAVAISHGNLSIVTAETPEVSQPNGFSQGETVVVPRTEVNVVEDEKPIFVMGPTTTVGDLANALNLLGVTPRDLSAIFQQLHAAEALHAELLFH